MSRYFIEGKLVGEGVAGLAPAFTILRNASTGGAPVVAAPAITLVDDVNCPGLHYFDYESSETVYIVIDMDPIATGPLVGVDRYVSRLLEPSDGALNTLSPHFRLTVPTFNAAGKLTSATMKYYPTSADALADTNALKEVSITATYDASGLITSYIAQGS